MPKPAIFGNAAAFTLIELLISMAIAATLAAIAIPNYFAYREKAKVAVAIAEIRLIEEQLAAYEADHDNLPEFLTEISLGNMLDPWGRPYQYLRIQFIDKNNSGKGKGGAPKPDGKVRKDRFLHPLNSDYDLYSMGRDGESVAPLTAKPSRDDVIRAADGAFIGLAADF